MIELIIVIVFFTLFGITPLLYTIYYFKFGRELSEARASGSSVTFLELLELKSRQMPSSIIIDVQIKAANYGFNVSIKDLCNHYLAGGNVGMVIEGLIRARKKKINLSFEQACAFDLQEKKHS